MKAILFDTPGSAHVLKIGDLPIPIPNDQQLLIKVEATAINRADILQRLGKYPPPAGESPVLGLEIAGTIEKMGKAVSGFKLGTKIFGLVGGGAYAQYCLIDAQMAIAVPSYFSMEQAAAVPEVFMTANETLNGLAVLKSSETVLVHAGSSGVGTAALQLAAVKKSRLIFTSGDDEKIKKVKTLFAETVECTGINYKKIDFAEKVLTITQQIGVDVVLDFIGNGYIQKHLQLLKNQGRLVQIALMGGAEVQINLRPILQKRLQIKGFVMRSQSITEKRATTQRFVEQCLPLFAKGLIKPVIDRVFDWTQAQEAHEYLEANQNVGKVVLRVG